MTNVVLCRYSLDHKIWAKNNMAANYTLET